MRRRNKVKWLDRINKWWLNYSYKHTTLAILAITLFIFLIDSVVLTGFLTFIERLGLLGGFVAGVLSVSFFTAAPALVLIIDLATKHDPYLLALSVAIGSTFGDWIILKFYQEKIIEELQPLLRRLRVSALVRLLRRRYTAWILFLIGVFVIATPLPDEAGLSLIGITHFKRRYVIFICFLLNIVGILAIILAAKALNG